MGNGNQYNVFFAHNKNLIRGGGGRIAGQYIDFENLSLHNGSS